MTLSCGLLCMVAGLGAARGASPGWTLPDGASQAAFGSETRLYGVAADIRYYEADLAVPDMIAYFEAHHPWLRDLAVLPGMVVLSGSRDGCTLAATVSEPAAGRSAGTLSHVCWPAPSGEPAIAPDWLPVGSVGMFDFVSHDEGMATQQQVWRHPARPPALRAMLRHRLVQAGWTPVTRPGEAGQAWQRAGRSLSLDVVPAGEGSAVVAWLLSGPGADGSRP
ncbi:hypothetical protein [Bordetella sp. 2513F-2]